MEWVPGPVRLLTVAWPMIRRFELIPGESGLPLQALRSLAVQVSIVARNGKCACRRQMSRGALDELVGASQEGVGCQAIADGRPGGKEPTAAMLTRHLSTEMDGTNGKRPSTDRAFLDEMA